MSTEPRPSVAVVVLDTLRKDAFERQFGWLPGQRYSRAFSTSHWTTPAHASLFTGRYASELGVHARRLGFDTDAPALAERLADAGYRTQAFSANVYVAPYFGFDRGFDEFESPTAGATDGEAPFDWLGFNRETDATGLRLLWEATRALYESDAPPLRSILHGARLLVSDDDLAYGGAREAREFVESTTVDGPEFLFCNLMEAHEPYESPEGYGPDETSPLTNSVGDLSSGPVSADHVRRGYEGAVAYLAEEYRDLFERLRERFDYVITCADHGESLGEGGNWNHMHGVRPEVTNVPLCVSGPGLDGVSDASVSLLDVHATVLDIAGLAPSDGARGRSLLSDDEGRESLTEFHGLTVGARQKLRDWGYGDRVETYDRPLRGYLAPEGAYGYETVDGFAVDAPDDGDGDGDGDSDTRKRSLRRRLGRLADEVVPRSDPTSAAVPDRVERRLQDLGYR